MAVKSVWNTMTALLLVMNMVLTMAAPVWAAESAAPETSEAVLLSQEEVLEPEEASEPEAEETPALEEASEPEAEEAPEPEDSSESEKATTAEKLPGISLLPMSESDLPDVEDDKDLISSKEAFVRVDKQKTIKLKDQPKADAYFVSKDPKVVSVKKNGESVVLKGVSVGRTVVEMRRSADDTLLDSVTVYGFRSSKTSQATGTRYNPGDLTVSGTDIPKRVYDLTCQKNQTGKSYKKYLSAHGCTLCSVTSVCSAYGVPDVSVDWLMYGGMEEVALRSGTVLKDKTLGYYGMQQVLAYAGISSKVYNWKNKDKANVEAAKEELVTALSEGRPVMMFMDKVPNGGWKGKVGRLFGDMHCITMVGINDSGKLLIANSIYPQGISKFKYNGKVQKLNITPGEMIDYFVRHSKMKRTKNDDFYFTKAGGLHTFIEVTCDKARKIDRESILDIGVKLEKSSYTYTGEAFTPKVTIGSLKEGRDFKVTYADNIKAGTAQVTVVGLGNYSGFKKLEFTIKRAPGEITASDKTIKSKTEEQEVKLGASAKGGAALSYASSDDAVSVDEDGVVTIPAGYVGSVTITIDSAQTANVDAASKQVTLTVEADQVLLEQGKLLVSDKSYRQSTKDRLVELNPVAQEGTVFTYESLDEDVTVDEDGVVTIPAEYVGVAKVTVTATLPDGTTSKSKTVKIRVEPRRVVKFTLKAEKKGRVTVRWKKANKVDGFQISYKCNGKKKTLNVNKGSATTAKLTGLRKGKTCEVRIRSRAKVGNTTLWSGWSGKRTVKVK